MSAKCYRVVTINGLAGSVKYLLVELAEDGTTETLLPMTFDTIEDAEVARARLKAMDAADKSGATPGRSREN